MTGRKRKAKRRTVRFSIVPGEIFLAVRPPFAAPTSSWTDLQDVPYEVRILNGPKWGPGNRYRWVRAERIPEPGLLGLPPTELSGLFKISYLRPAKAGAGACEKAATHDRRRVGAWQPK